MYKLIGTRVKTLGVEEDDTAAAHTSDAYQWGDHLSTATTAPAWFKSKCNQTPTVFI